MADPLPLFALEKKYRNGGLAAGDRLVEASRQNNNRRHIYSLNHDTHKNISSFGRATLETLGRWLFSNYDAVRGPVRRIATFSSRTVIADVESTDPNWSALAEAYLIGNERFIDYRGEPYNMRQWRRQLTLSTYRDGGKYTLLTRSPAGRAWIQPIMSHRIGCAGNETEATVSAWQGNAIVDGVIIDDIGRPIAYRYLPNGPGRKAVGQPKIARNAFGQVTTSTAYASDGAIAFIDIGRRSIIPSFLPDYGDQLRGFSLLGASLFEWQDLKERRSLELQAQKAAASIGIIEHNDTGGVDATTAAIAAANAAGDNATAAEAAAAAEYSTKNVDGVDYRFFKAGSGAGLSTIQWDRPSANVQEHERAVKRDAVSGFGWFLDLEDPTKVNGGALRWCIDAVNATVDEFLDLVIVPAQRRVDNYQLADAILAGILPPPPASGYSLNDLAGRKITADAKYDAQVTDLELSQGTGTRKKFAAQRGGQWERNLAQLATEAERVLEAAHRLKERFPDMTIDALKNMILAGMNPSARPQFDETDHAAD